MMILGQTKLIASWFYTMLSSRYQKFLNISKLHWQPASFLISNKFSQKYRKFSTKKISDNYGDSFYKFRPMREEDIGQMIRLRRKFTFQESVSSYEMCHKVDQEAFLVAADENDRVIGFGSIKNSSHSLSYGGCLTVHPDYWKLGLAKKMIMHHLPRVGSRNVLSMSEAHLVQFYAPFFPVLEKEFIIIDVESREEINVESLSFANPPCTEVKHFQEEYLSVVLEFDRKVIGFDRREDVIFNCLDVHGKTVVALNGSKCVGYGCIQLNIQGAARVGPLYAENPVVAEAMLKKLLETFPYGKGFAVSMPSNNLDAVKLFGKLGKMKTVNNFRMSSKERFTLDTTSVYAIFDGEFHPF